MKTRPIVSAFVASVALTMLMVLVTHLSAAEPDALISSTFDTNAEGWEVLGNIEGGGGPLTPAHEKTGGNPGGYIRTTDQAAGRVWYWSAPAKFEGNRSTYYGGTLSFDLYQSPDTLRQLERTDDVRLQGRGVNLEYDTPNNPGTTWTHYSVPLIQDGRWLKFTPGISPTKDRRDPATALDIQTALSNISTLAIRGEYREEGDAPGTVRDTGGLDNVVLAESGDVTPTATTTTTTTATTVPTPTATTVPTPTATTVPVSRRVYLPLVVR